MHFTHLVTSVHNFHQHNPAFAGYRLRPYSFYYDFTEVMYLSDFYFDLPDELIARYPKRERSSSRMLQLNGQNGELFHRTFSDIADLINRRRFLIFNNTRVIPAKCLGEKQVVEK